MLSLFFLVFCYISWLLIAPTVGQWNGVKPLAGLCIMLLVDGFIPFNELKGLK